jgi:predicted TIM-barrel fold metal-dependent hydrolase
VLVPLAGYISNEFVARVCARHEGRLVPAGSFNPADHRTSRRAALAIRSELKDCSLAAIKLHPRLHRYDPLDPRCIAVLEEMETWTKPPAVWLDTLFYFRGGRLRKPLVDTIHDLVGRFAGLTFVLLHGGGSWILQVADAVRDCENAFLDISFTLSRFAKASVGNDIRHLCEVFDRRLIFGSDFPEIDIPGAVGLVRNCLKGLPTEKKNNVLGRNLAAILGEPA